MKWILFVVLMLFIVGCSEQQSVCVQEKLSDQPLKKLMERGEYNPGTILLTLEHNVSKDNVKGYAISRGLVVEHDYNTLNILAIGVPEGEELDWICKFEVMDEVKNGELDLLLKI
ncbi:hypothetical protein ACFLZX_01825 [Nanoarchaeota archaeon]